MTIYSTFEAVADRRRDHTAVIYLGTRYSYRKVKALAESFSAALIDLGVTPGQKAVIYIPNSIQWVIAWLGIQRAGAVGVPITPIYTPHDLKYIANDSGADTIICADTNFGYVQKVLLETDVKRVIVTRMAGLLPLWKQYFGFIFNVVPKGKVAYDQKTYSFRKLLQQYRGRPVDTPKNMSNGWQLAEVLYTGGTTKFPKGVPISRNLFLASADEQIRISEPLFPSEENVIMGNAPLFHILGQTCSLAILLVGGTLMIQPRINLDATFDAIQRFQARTMIGVPALYRMILEHDRLKQYDLSTVQYWFSAGDVLPVEVGKRWHEMFGRPIH